MTNINHKQGVIDGVKFEIRDSKNIRVWKPKEAPIEEFKLKCELIVKYLIDEGFFDKKSCNVTILGDP